MKIRKPRKYDEARNVGQYRKYSPWALFWLSDVGCTFGSELHRDQRERGRVIRNTVSRS